MNYKNYELLNLAEQKCYHEILRHIESYQIEWSFSQVSFDFVAKVYQSVLKDHPEYFWLSLDCDGTTRTYGSEMTVLFRPRVEVESRQIPNMRRQFNNYVENLIERAKRQSS